MPKGQLKRAKRLKKGPKNPFLNLKNKKSVFRRVVKRLNTEKSKKITERGKGKNHGRLRLFAQPRVGKRATHPKNEKPHPPAKGDRRGFDSRIHTRPISSSRRNTCRSTESSRYPCSS